MMGLGYFGSSSSSNLSPLAPPFTVERSNHNRPNLSSNLESSFNGTSYGVPCSSPWPHSHSSTASQGLLADSIRTATVPSANNYMSPGSLNLPSTHNRSGLNSSAKSGLEPVNPPAAHFSAVNPNPQHVTGSLSYNLTEAEPFCHPYASLTSDDGVPFVALNEHGYDLLHATGLGHGDGSSQVDYSRSLSALKYDTQQVGIWSGRPAGSRGKSLDSEHSFFLEEANIADSLAYKNYLSQGAYGAETLSKGKEDSATFPGIYPDVVVRENNIGPSITGTSHVTSFSAKYHGFVPNGLSKECTCRAVPLFSQSHPLASSPEPPKDPWNGRRSYTPHEKRLNMFDCSSDPMSPSITKSSPSLVIKPPSPLSTFSAQGAVSTKSVEISSISAFNSNDVVGRHNPLKEKEPHLQPSVEAKGSCLALNQLSFQIGRTDDDALVDPSSMREDVSNKVSTDGRLNFEFKAGSNFQVHDICSTEDVRSAANFSEHSDHRNPAEDSPCWKGAPTHFSPFGSAEAEPSQHRMKKLQTTNGVNLQGSQTDHSINHSSKVSSLEPHENSVSNERKSAPTPTEKEHKSGEGVVVGFNSAKASKGAQSSLDIAKLRKGYGFLSEPSTDANSQASRPKLPNLNEDVLISEMRIQPTDGVMDHTVHASVDNTANLASAENLDVNVLVKALSNLSALLLLHCSNDECGLKEQDYKALDHVIGNLDECMSRKIQQVAPMQKYTLPQHSTSDVLQKGAYAGKSPVTNRTADIFHDQAGHRSVVHLERNNNHFGKNIEKVQACASLRDDDLPKDHNMVQTIKKVLDENLECKEELPSQTLLYKNLWLEAEAELCALSYRARFHRKKREMDKSKAADVYEVAADIKKISSSSFSPTAAKLIHKAAGSKIPSTHAHNPSLSSIDSHIDDVENSVMTRFNILKRHGESNLVTMEEKKPADVEVSGNEIQSSGVAEGPHLQHHLDDEVVMHSHGNQKMQYSLALGIEDVEPSVMARLNVLKCQGESDPVNVEARVLADGAHAEVSGKGSQSRAITVGPHFKHQAGKEHEAAMGSSGTSRMQNWFEPDLCSTSYGASSDWEHVLNDEFSW